MTLLCVAAPISRLYTSGVGGGGGGTGGVQLSSGHYVNQQFSMTATHPRPDSETGTFAATNAFHRYAYYDGGANSVTYYVAIKIFGGSPPHRYTLIAGPTGASIGNTWTAASHGVVTWIPTQSYSTASPATFTVRVTGQDGVVIASDITWTVATSSDISTSGKFIFISQSGNDSTGNGSMSSPWKTLSKVMGATAATTTYPGCFVYIRGSGTAYGLTPHSDVGNLGNTGETGPCRISLCKTRHPMFYSSYPGESVTIDMSNAQFTGGTIPGYTPSDRSDDLVFSGSPTAQLTLSGYSTVALERYDLWLFSADRSGRRWVTYDGFVGHTNSLETNSAPFHSSGSGVNYNYNWEHGVQEINRTTAANTANEGLLRVIFAQNYWVDEYCSGSTTLQIGVGMKDTCNNTSTRYCQVLTPNTSGQEGGFLFLGQNGGGNNEICFSFIRCKLWFRKSISGALGKIVSFRNTVIAHDQNYAPGIMGFFEAADTGPFTSIDDAVISDTTPHIADGTGSYMAITSSGTECQATYGATDSPFNVTTGILQDVVGHTAWRATYLGTRGWEIQ